MMTCRATRVAQVVTLAALLVTAALGAATEPLRFSFGTTSDSAGATRVSPTTLYQTDTGFGFEPGGKPVAHDRCVTSDQPFLFSVRLAEGNYRVRVTLGSDVGDSSVTVKAEARRLMIENVSIPKGQSASREFTVNLRTPKIGPDLEVRLKQREKDAERVTWDDRLTLEFNGTRPSVRRLEIRREPDAPTVFLAGDSTVCDQPLEPWNSWGQMLPRFLKPGPAVANYAQSGESIKSSLAARRFEKIFNEMKAGDWLLVQFGHNDMKDRAPDALAVYRTNLRNIIARTRQKGGTPVLITSMERKAGVKGPTLEGYPDAVRTVAREEKVAMVDLHATSIVLYQALGANLDQAFQDGTHHNSYGSYLLAKCVAAGIQSSGTTLAKFVTDDMLHFDPAKPDSLATFKIPSSPTASTVKPDGN